MKSTKMMLLGLLIMLFGTGLSLDTTRVAELYSGLISFDAWPTLTYIISAIILAGFIVGLVGYFRKN